MPVPRGSLFGVPNENFAIKDPNKKHIQWDDENLRENERTKSAKDIIDEPDTPWASPPPELFDSDAEDEDVLEEDVANKRKMYAEEEIKERLERLEMTDTRQSTGVEFVLETTTDTSRSHFSSSDDNKEEELKEENDDTILKSRLFEAQRKSLQCTYDRKRGTTFNKTSHPFVAHHEKEEDEDEKDEEEIKRELEALLNMQRKG